MRIVWIGGGLGNQMFQYVIYCQLKKTGEKIYIGRENYFGGRPYALDKFGISLQTENEWIVTAAIIWDLIWRECIRHNYLYHLFYRFGLRKRQYENEAYTYFEDYTQKGNIYLKGYWQNIKYFEGVEDDIRKAFSVQKVKFQPRNLQWRKEITATESVAVHVRGGDYLRLKKLYGGICTKEYYEEAIRYIEERVDHPVFYVFSNDMEYARNILPERDYIFVEGNTEADAVEEMMLIRSCKHQIIANSTFSWWAAWLNDNPEKLVVMPEEWVNGKGPVNLAEDGWKVIKAVK